MTTAGAGPDASIRHSVLLRFLAAPTDADETGAVARGQLLEWIDKAGYACAVGWSGRYCVTAYVGDIRFSHSVAVGEMVEVAAHVIATGRSSMHVLVQVSSADPRERQFRQTTSCLTVFVAVDSKGASVEVPAWVPETDEQQALADMVERRLGVRQQIVEAMKAQSYDGPTTAPATTLRFLASPTVANWGGKVHGGTAMRWIDEAAYACASSYSHGLTVATYAGGVRFYRPLHIGSLIEVYARLLHTAGADMHISVHVRSSDPRGGPTQLATHCLIVFTAVDTRGEARAISQWEPETPGDVALEAHARDLVRLRKAGGADAGSPATSTD